MIIKPFNQRAINPAVVGMVLAVLSAFVLFVKGGGKTYHCGGEKVYHWGNA